MRTRLKLLATACALLALGAQAQTADPVAWPTKPVTLVVPYPPGGTSDVVGRQLAQRLREELGTVFVIDNRAGAATAIGASFVARAPKDGYTLLLSAGTTFTTNPHLNDKLSYKLDDFAPVAALCTVPFAFVVKKDFPAKTLREYVSYAKANPGKINTAPNGQGSMVQLLGETWYGVFAPVGTPQPLVDKLAAAIHRITTSASFGEAMRKLGNESKTSATPADLLAFTQQQSKMWGDLIKRLDLKAE